jgi:hypothetical protein
MAEASRRDMRTPEWLTAWSNSVSMRPRNASFFHDQPMTLPPQPDANPQRSATRAPVEVEIRVQFDDSLEVHFGRCYNISIGGLFVELDSTRPPGGLVRFEILMEDGSVRGLAEIVWAQEARAGRRGGLGLKFRFLEQRDRQLIFKLVSQHIKDRLAQRPPMVDEPPSPNTALARQRRATLLGEGVPVAPAPVPTITSSVPRLSPEPSAPSPPPAAPSWAASPSAASLPAVEPEPPAPEAPPREERFPSTPDADDLVVRTGASPLPVMRDDAPPPSSITSEPPTRTSPRRIDPSWLTAADDDEPEARGVGDLPLAASKSAAPRGKMTGLGFGDNDGEEAEPFDVEAEERAERHYLDSSDPDHFAHRPKPRRRLPWLILIPALLLLAAFGYFVGGKLWHQVASDSPAAASAGGSDAETEVLRIGQGQTTTPLPAEPGPAPTTAPVPPLQPEPAPSAPDEAAGETAPAVAGPAETTPAQVPEPEPERTPEPSPAAPLPVAREPESTLPPAVAKAQAELGPRAQADLGPSAQADLGPSAQADLGPSAQAFRRITDIQWRKIPDGVEVTIETDGRIGDERFDKFRLEGATPREVIRFYGVEKKFEKVQLVVGSLYLQQIRLGWHADRPRGNELHVVLDVGTSARVHRVRNLGTSLAVEVKKN